MTRTSSPASAGMPRTELVKVPLDPKEFLVIQMASPKVVESMLSMVILDRFASFFTTAA
jgi:hypothetical protein